MSVVWGPNSQGKTSLAEAFEFLSTGDTARREMLASALGVRLSEPSLEAPVLMQRTLGYLFSARPQDRPAVET